jgi:hypothetical protein
MIRSRCSLRYWTRRRDSPRSVSPTPTLHDLSRLLSLVFSNYESLLLSDLVGLI